MPYIAGHAKFPSYIRKSRERLTLPYLVFRNGAHIVALCETSDDKGGIKENEQVAKDHGMIGIVVKADISAWLLACFIRGSHDSGTFVDLIMQHQFDTEEKKDSLWLFHCSMEPCAGAHGAIARLEKWLIRVPESVQKL